MENIKIGNEIELQAIYDSRKSFYKKAFTRTDNNRFGTYHSLFSYGTFIIELKENNEGDVFINAMTEDDTHLTTTTLRHLNEFIQQHGLERRNKKEWIHELNTCPNYDI